MAGERSSIDGNLIRLNNRISSSSNEMVLDLEAIAVNGYQIIRSYGTDLVRFEQDLNRISKEKLFYSDRIGSVCHSYKVLPDSENFSEQVGCGGFHTDFMFQAEPPEYIALLCLEADPKHPFYGRNQIVSKRKFISKVQELVGLSEKELEQHYLTYSLPGHGVFKYPLLNRMGDNTIFRFHELLIDEQCDNSEILPQEKFIAFLHSVFMDVCEDVCLDRGDLLVISNHQALHRRSECSISYKGSTSRIVSREMASIRFNV
jgi:hypothetical protein